MLTRIFITVYVSRRLADIDECAESLAECQRLSECVNNQGSYSCKCAAGYEMTATGYCAGDCQTQRVKQWFSTTVLRVARGS